MSVTLHFLDQTKAVAIAGEHAVVLDRTREQGGDNSGFRARELWLASLLSCASGTLKLLAKEDGITSVITGTRGELALDDQNEIVTVQLSFTFAATVTAAQQNRWLGRLTHRCLLLKTVASHIDVQLKADEPIRADINPEPVSTAPAPLHTSCALQGVC